MKKKILMTAIVLVLIASLLVCVGCTSGNTFNKYNGTYTASISVLGVELASSSIIISGGTATFDGLEDYTEYATTDIVIDGDTITFSYDGTDIVSGTIDGDAITIWGVKYEKE